MQKPYPANLRGLDEINETPEVSEIPEALLDSKHRFQFHISIFADWDFCAGG